MSTNVAAVSAAPAPERAGNQKDEMTTSEKQTAALARSITWKGSKQYFFIATVLSDRDLTADALRAYAYFRWADDVIDLQMTTAAERTAFARKQEAVINSLYRGEALANPLPEERMLADLIAHDPDPASGLGSFIRNFIWVLSFDAARSGKPVSRAEMETYTEKLAVAVMDGLQYFMGRRTAYPRTPTRTRSVVGAHITHMLRDVGEDIQAGIINIPREDLAAGVDPAQPESEAFRAWVRERVTVARAAFREGRPYIESLTVLRCKLAGILYCARFERVLDCIEADGYRLRAEYGRRRELAAWLEMIRLGIGVILRHVFSRRLPPNPAPEPAALEAREKSPTR